MKYYKNELGHLVSVEDKMWTRMVILQPGLVEVGPPKEEIKIDKLIEINSIKAGKLSGLIGGKEFDKLKSEDNEDSGIRPSRPTPKRRATKRRKPSVLGEAAKNKGRAQKV